MPDPLQTVCCCCNVFRAAKGLTLIEFVLILLGVILSFFNSSIGLGIFWTLLQLVYLAVEYYGIHKEHKCLILFGCIIRILQMIIIAILIIVFLAVPICPDMLGKDDQMMWTISRLSRHFEIIRQKSAESPWCKDDQIYVAALR